MTRSIGEKQTRCLSLLKGLGEKGSPVKVRHGARHCDGELCGSKSLKDASGRRRQAMILSQETCLVWIGRMPTGL